MNVVYHTHTNTSYDTATIYLKKSNETIAFLIPLDYNNPKKRNSK